MNTTKLYAPLNAVTVSYGNKEYRIQKDRNYRCIIVHENGQRKKISVLEEKPDYVFDYIFRGGFQSYRCPAMDYWIIRHRMGKKITTREYKMKYLT